MSDDSPERGWSTFELEIGKQAAAKRTEDYLLPLLVGPHRPQIIGMPELVGHISLQDRPLDDVAELAQEKVLTLPPILVSPGGYVAGDDDDLLAEDPEASAETADE